MDYFNLFLLRTKSFLAEAIVMIAVAVIGVMASPEFALLLTNEFGPIWGGGVGVLFLNGIVKHLLNLKAIKDYNTRPLAAKLGEDQEPLILI